MNDPLDIPEHIRKAAATVEIFFKVNGINEWALMGIQSRNDCREQLEQCEKQIMMDTECIERIRKAGETAEVRLAEAMDHIRWLQPMAKGWANAHESIASNHRIVLAADEFLEQTTPPPILAELQGLRDGFDALVKGTIAAKEKSNAELAALKAELEQVKTQRDQTHQSNILLKSGWQRVGDQFKAGCGPREFIRFNDACKKHVGNVVETILDCVFSLWADLDKHEQEHAALKLKLEAATSAVKYYAQPEIYEVMMTGSIPRIMADEGLFAREALSQLNESEEKK